MFHFQQTPGRSTIVDGKEHLFFSGYAYLGMHCVPEFVELVKEGMDKFGFVFPSSRISNTQLDLFDEFECRLSDITGMESTVCYSSGFLAARAVLELYKYQKISCAPNTHPAFCLEKSNHSSFTEWRNGLHGSAVIAFDSVNPLTAEVNDTSFLNNIEQPITCVIDDSHGAGLLNDGHGVAGSLTRKQHIRQAIVYSLSKAYGLVGGAVSCSNEIAGILRAGCFYTASTSVSPALAFAFLHGQSLYEQQRGKLYRNIHHFSELTGNRFTSHPSLPVFVLPENTNEQKLADNRFIISSFAYPDPAGKRVKRVVLNALHGEEDLVRLAESLTLFS